MPNEDRDDTTDDNDGDNDGDNDSGGSGVPFDVRRVRAKTLAGLYTLAEKVLTDQSGYRCLYLSCSQYFADEAGDAVHEGVTVASSLWPRNADVTASYDRLDYQVRWSLEWDSNEDAVYAFAPLCNEEGFSEDAEDEDMISEEGGSPSALAIVQRLDDGELRATWLGALHRPWLDFPAAMKDRDQGYDPVPDFVLDPPMPALVGREQALYAEVLADPADLGIRDVLRDQWMLRNDPRGELTALTTTKHLTDELRIRVAELILEHGRSWLGPLAAVVPFSGALFGPGPFVRKAIVYAPDKQALAKVANAREWATVEDLTFANQSARMVTPAMKNLRSVGPLAIEELEPLRTGTWRIATLDVIDEGESLAAVASLPLPLTCLRVRTDLESELELEPLEAAAWWPTLERVEIWLSGRFDGDACKAMFDKLAPKLREGCVLAVGHSFSGERSGWVVVGTAHKQRLELVRLDARLDQGAELAARFGCELPSAPAADADDWLLFGLGVARRAPAPSTAS